MEWRDAVRRKRELLKKAVGILLSKNRVDAVEISRQLGIDVNSFVIFISDDLIEIAKSKGYKVIYGRYDPESGLVSDRLSNGRGLVVPIFIRA